VRLPDERFGDEMLPFTMGSPSVVIRAKSQTGGNGKKHALNELREHARADFSCLHTGDESWMLYPYPYGTQ
jgi:hypothetical protein